MMASVPLDEPAHGDRGARLPGDTPGYSFTVPGRPCAKQSLRFTRTGHRYQPIDVLAYCDKIAFYATQASNGCGLLRGPLSISIIAHFAVAPSWSKKRQLAAQWHAQRPDGDNLLKAVLDGLKTVVFHDDAQVSRITLEKCWTRHTERLEVVISRLGGAP